MSVDDTQLLPGLRPYYDEQKHSFFLLGAEGDPICLPDPERFADIIEGAEISKATKACAILCLIETTLIHVQLRLWCIQVPLPDVPTIIVAAIGIGNKADTQTLLGYSLALINGFLDRGVHIVAYAADGSAVERSIQKTLSSGAPGRKELQIQHPSGSGRIKFDIPLFGRDGNQPVVMIQDSQHACKTARNNSFSGARMLILGNYTVLFEDLRRLYTESGPLYGRDVEKLDRQDDNAAIRLFSGDALHWLTKKHPELVGPIIFLFVFGELIDSYQSRQIGHTERVKMALRAFFFLEIWELFLDTAGYPKDKYFISKEACDIMYQLARGLIELVIVFRDFNDIYPLIPHLISTEACEHVFGVCRQLIADFSLLDFYYMVPKLFVQLRKHNLFKSSMSDGKERASGYNHLYFDTRGIDMHLHSTYPTDDEIQEVTIAAYQEVENLWHVLGFDPAAIDEARGTRLPSISAWFSPGDSNTFATPQVAVGNDVDTEDTGVYDLEETEQVVGQSIREAIKSLEGINYRSSDQHDKVINLTLSAVGLSFQSSVNL